LNHLTDISSYGLDLVERVKSVGQHDEKYQQAEENLQKGSEDRKDEVNNLTDDGLIRFKNRIYVSITIDLKRLIMKEFHVHIYFNTPHTKRLSWTSKSFIIGLV